MSRSIAWLALVAAVAFSVACGDDGISPERAQSRLKILPDSVATAAFWPGDTVRLEPRRLDASGAPLAGDTARFVWQSSDTSVVVIDSAGLATVVSFGEATITLRVADATNPSVGSTRDTATSTIALVASPAVIHPGPILAAFTGAGHQCVVLASGRAHCRGSNSWGQAGTGMLSGHPVASWTPVLGDLTFSSITGGILHTCALATDASAWCWGENRDGAIGLGTTVPDRFWEPTGAFGDHRWRMIDADGHSQTCGVTTADVPICVGHNDFGQVGREPISYIDSIVAEWGTGHRLTMIETDHFHTCGVTTDGDIYCSGRGGAASNTGSLSHGTPTRIGGSVVFRSIAIGNEHGCGLDAAGAAHCWGRNGWGQLGTGDHLESGTARPVVGGLTFERIYAFEWTSCGVTTAGETWCWGSNAAKLLGRAGIERSTVPIRLNIGLGAHSIDRLGTLGVGAACAIDGSARLVCWGNKRTSW